MEKKLLRISAIAAFLIVIAVSVTVIFLHFNLPGIISERVEKEISIFLDPHSDDLYIV